MGDWTQSSLPSDIDGWAATGGRGTGRGLAVSVALIVALLAAGCGSAPGVAHGGGAANGPGTANAAASYYKGKTITWIVPYGAGGGYDVVSRLIAPYFAKATGAKVVVENKPGAGGLVGVNDMAIAKPDGLTVALMNGPGVVASAVAKQAGIRKAAGMHFDLKTLSWIGRVTSKVELLFVAPDSRFKSVADLLKSPGTIKYASTGPGSTTYLVGIILQQALGKQVKIVSGFKGGPGMVAAVLRHEVALGDLGADTGSRQVKAGTLHGILVVSDTRYPFLPKVATLQAVKGLVSKNGYALIRYFADTMDATGRALATTPRVPAGRVAFLSASLKKALGNHQLIAQARQRGFVPAYLTGPQEFALIERASANADMRSLVVKSFGGT